MLGSIKLPLAAGLRPDQPGRQGAPRHRHRAHRRHSHHPHVPGHPRGLLREADPAQLQDPLALRRRRAGEGHCLRSIHPVISLI